jgi:hypothetical protein
MPTDCLRGLHRTVTANLYSAVGPTSLWSKYKCKIPGNHVGQARQGESLGRHQLKRRLENGKEVVETPEKKKK